MLIIVSVGYNIYQSFFGIPSVSPKGKVSISIEKGQSITQFADKLALKKAIISSSGFLWQEKFHPVTTLLEGDYEINLPATPEQILDQINAETVLKKKQLEADKNIKTSKVTLIEGDDLDDIAVRLEKAGIVNAQEFRQFAQNPANFSQVEYPFLPPALDCKYGEMNNCAKYYIEGYLYPDTYTFVQPSSVADVYKKLLRNFSTRVWSKVSNSTNSKDFYKIVTLASVIEKESGRTKGVTAASLPELNQERKNIASVFTNRLGVGMKWQSNPTVEYGQVYKLCESTFERAGCRFLNDDVFEQQYNTYKVSAYPIGPIANPQYDNITAALQPPDTNYLFFVADLTGKTYFASNDNEFNSIVEKVKSINAGL
jgi:UPF0755 protein